MVAALLDVLARLAAWVDEIPPAQQAMRYGNKAFRVWHARLAREAPALVATLLHAPAAAGAEAELAPYLCDAFGNATRIDYGTGHETTFVVFLCAWGGGGEGGGLGVGGRACGDHSRRRRPAAAAAMLPPLPRCRRWPRHCCLRDTPTAEPRGRVDWIDRVAHERPRTSAARPRPT